MIHFAEIYHRPSWQGGDVLRAACLRGTPGFSPVTTTREASAVSCPRCAERIGVPRPVVVRAARRFRPTPLAAVGKLTMRQAASLVCERWDCAMEDLTGPDHGHAISAARQEAMWLMDAAGYGPSQIGRFFNRDHSTAIHGIRRHEARLAQAQEQAA